MNEIYKELLRCKSLGIRGVLGTVISTKGSTYQKPGAKCFIAEDGKLTGLVSGGCVEGDLKEIAIQIIENDQPQIVHYDFHDEGDLIWGMGLGCNGKMNIFLEPYYPLSDISKSIKLEEFFKMGSCKTVHCITVTKAENSSLVGERWIINPQCPDYDQISFKEISNDYMRRIDWGFSSPVLVNIDSEQKFEVFYDRIDPVPSLLIFGAGPDVIPLVEMAKTLKWQVTVLDHRPSFVNKENFPHVDELICYIPGKVPKVKMDKNTYVVLMSHHFSQDQIILREVLNNEVAYIGVLGPRKRTNQLGSGLGISNHPNFNKIHSPIGLNVGSVTPEEIALSILSEILMVYRGGTESKLTDEMSIKEKAQLQM